jgi:ELWxxDGT repeat protein
LWRTDGTPAGTYPLGSPGAANPFGALDSELFERLGNRIVYTKATTSSVEIWSSDGLGEQRLTEFIPPVRDTPIAPFQRIGTAGSVLYLSSNDFRTPGIWRTDGTLEHTFRSSLPRASMVAGDDQKAFVWAWIAANQNFSLLQYLPESDSYTELTTSKTAPQGLFSFDSGQLLFTGSDSTQGLEPWVSDGTPAGTKLLKDAAQELTGPSSAPEELTAFGGVVAFIADDYAHGRDVWVSDGTEAGTKRVGGGSAGNEATGLMSLNGAILWFRQNEFFRLAGVDGTAEEIKTLDPHPCGRQSGATMGGRLYFSAAASSEPELWSTDGTSAGTLTVSGTSPFDSSFPCDITASGQQVFFTAYNGPDPQAIGRELWVTDGTASGTKLVLDVAVGMKSSNPSDFTAFTGGVYFSADDGIHGRELWISDGTATGTTLVSDIVGGPGSSGAAPIGMLSGKLLLKVVIADDTQLWISDGSSAGTSRLGTMVLPAHAEVFVNGNLAYFPGNDGSGFEPWVTNGTSAGTHVLKEIESSGGSDPGGFANFNGRTMFEAGDPSHGRHLFRTDGTTAGTEDMGVIPSAPMAPLVAKGPRQLAVGSRYYFAAADVVTGTELYVFGNDVPVAAADSAVTSHNASVTIRVLINDIDGDGTVNSSTVHISTAPSHGAVSIMTDGSLSYQPNAGFSGTDTFAYTVEDNEGAVSAPATVTVIVSPAPPAPEKGHGGGAFGLLELLMLALMLISLRHGRSARLESAVPR